MQIVGEAFGPTPQRDVPTWTLVLREQVFELCGTGPATKAVRVRGLEGDAAVEGAKVWQRELDRRETSRLKAVEEASSAVSGYIASISELAPDMLIGDYGGAYDGSDSETFAVSRERILQAIHSMSESDAIKTMHAIRAAQSIARQAHEKADRERKIR